MTKKSLSEKERERYDRQMIIQGFGEEGQLELKNSHVTLVGLGGLGSPISIYLVAAGVGHLTIIDSEKVELSNLNRQVLHWDKDIGRPKAESAIEKLRELNPSVEIDSRLKEVTSENIGELLEGIDIVVDGLDNFPTRYLVNEACVEKRIPFVHGAVEGLIGQLSTILPGEGPCLKCIFPTPPPEKPTFPVLGATPAVMGCLEAIEVIKLITGVGEPLVGKILTFNGENLNFDELQVERDPECPVCGGI